MIWKMFGLRKLFQREYFTYLTILYDHASLCIDFPTFAGSRSGLFQDCGQV